MSEYVQTESIVERFKTSGIFIGFLTASMWVLEGIDFLLNNALDRFGIQPWSFDTIQNIFLAPFLHGGFRHLMANTIPFVILGLLVARKRVSSFVLVTLCTIAIGGLGVWLTGGRNTTHLGASILIFGYLGYLLLNSYFERSWQAITIAAVIVFLYGGMLWGVLPGQPGISWQGHLFGFIGGCVAARWLAPKQTLVIDTDMQDQIRIRNN